MTMTWSLYDLKTGDLSGVHISGPADGFIESNTPEGFGAVVGRHDYLTKMVVDDAVVDRSTPLVLPPSPGQVMVDIVGMEADQLRSIRELLLDPSNETARTKLQDIDDQISGLRDQMAVAKAEADEVKVEAVDARATKR